MTRVAVFIDYQNVYKGARSAFGYEDSTDFTHGQVFPRRLGIVVTDRGRAIDPERVLEKVVVFRGEPSGLHSPRGLAACQRQTRFWNAQNLVTAVTRPLKYYPNAWDSRGNVTDWIAREKGIDVLIALAMVVGAIRDEFDVAVVCSADSDLAPAVEQVREFGKRCEVFGWRSKTWRSRLSVTPNVWCHWLDRTDYGRLYDGTDYTIEQPPPTTTT